MRISRLTGGILIRDTNNVIVAYNLFLDCDEVGLDTISGINGPRPIFGHTNDVHNLMVSANIFYNMGRSAIEFTNARNEADGNVYDAAATSALFAQPFLRVKTPEPPEWHDPKSCRQQHAWDQSGAMAAITALVDPDKLELNLALKGGVQPAPAYKGIDTDLFGRPVPGARMPGPFADLATASGTRTIDPR